MAVAADVPGKFDVVINGQGYVFLDSLEPSLPFRTHRAVYTRSPTFIDRQNVQGNFGDDQQDFWFTASQDDWSEGGEQRFWRKDDDVSRSRYWRSSGVDISIPGQATLLPGIVSVDFGVGISATNASGQPGTVTRCFAAVSAGNLYEVAADGTVTDRGAHGAGNLTGYSVASDLGTGRLFIAGATKLRKYDTAAHTFADFSASTMSSCVYLNNSLYGMDNSGAVLKRFDTAGVATDIYTWKDATGASLGTQTPVAGYGGKLLILRLVGEAGGELWLYDGVGANRIAQFPDNFLAWGLCVSHGIVYISGALVTENNTKYQSAVYYYANGTIGLLWKAVVPTTDLSYPSIAQFQGRLIWTDETEGRFLALDLPTGAIFSPGTFTKSAVLNPSLAGGGSSFLHARATRFGYLFPSTTRPSSGTVTTSLFDFDSSLDKRVRGVKLDFIAATDGNGGSVDVAYQLNSLDGSYTSLATGVTAGTEIAIDQTCRSISLQITLNKGTSTLGPQLKRIYIRAAPILDKRKKREYVFDCTGTSKQPQKLRDGTRHPKSGRDQINDLNTAADLTAPFSITDRFGTFTGLIDLNDSQGFGAFEIHPAVDEPANSGSFIAQVMAREV